MKLHSNLGAFSLLVLLAVSHHIAVGQVSLGFSMGFAGSLDKKNGYSLSQDWPPKSGNSEGESGLVFYKEGKGLSKVFNLNWDASPVFGLGLAYRSIHFTMDQNHREATNNSFGVMLKVNFTKNTEKIVPYIQTEYMFSNSSKLHQVQATSSQHPDQTQPAFDHTYKSSLGIGGDLGVEVRLSGSWRLNFHGGFHGVQVTKSSKDDFLLSLNYGNYLSPSNIDGTFFLQFNGGIKYYFGNQKKKRDF